MLGYYAERFKAVEINSSFYQAPEVETLKRWRAEVPATFQFALKAPQQMTHHRRLNNAEGLLKEFLKSASSLGRKKGPVLFQLPPNFPKAKATLEHFLRMLPRRGRFAFEFRHPSWFDDETFFLLKRRGVALCVAQADDASSPLVATAHFGYLRLRKSKYSLKEIADWARFIQAQSWESAHVFFKHEDEATGPRYAEQLAKKVG